MAAGVEAAGWVHALPTVNAAFNTACACCLAAGYVFIRRGDQARHRVSMLAAVACSTIFMASYLTYHLHPTVGTVKFVDPSWLRPYYLVMLATHVVLAVPVVPMALLTLYLALRGKHRAHRRLARVTLPVWFYVSVTGVLVYLVLYVVFPQR
jgi:putative membrane protein